MLPHITRQQSIDATLDRFLIKDIKLLVFTNFLRCNKCFLPIYRQNWGRQCNLIQDCQETLCEHCWSDNNVICDFCSSIYCQGHLTEKCNLCEGLFCDDCLKRHKEHRYFHDYPEFYCINCQYKISHQDHKYVFLFKRQ